MVKMSWASSQIKFYLEENQWGLSEPPGGSKAPLYYLEFIDFSEISTVITRSISTTLKDILPLIGSSVV